MGNAIGRRSLLLLAAAFAAAAQAAEAEAGRLAGVTLGRQGRAARLTLRLAGPQRWEARAETAPARLLLDLPGARIGRLRVPNGAGPVRALRLVPEAAQIRLDLAEPAALRALPGPAGQLVFAIEPVSAARFAALARGGAFAQGGTGDGRDRQAAAPLPLVVLDPGHGGRDPGTIGVSGTHEKRITLAAAEALRAALEASGSCRVAMTRSRDVFVPLADRVEFARRRGAALFVSLHADSAPGARGASVYTLSDTATDAMSAALAQRENRADLAGGMRLPSVSPEVQRILMSLMRQETRSGSSRLARLAVARLGESVNLLPHTHRQAGFVVLKAPDVPSILVEMGFLSDARDEAALNRPEHRRKLAAALAQAVQGWLARHGSTMAGAGLPEG